MRVLVIEECPVVFSVYELVFEQRGHEVFHASSIKDGHELMTRFKEFFELVIFRGQVFSAPHLMR